MDRGAAAPHPSPSEVLDESAPFHVRTEDPLPKTLPYLLCLLFQP